MTARLTPPEVESFRDLIGQRMGLRVEDGKLGFLAEVLARRLGATQSSCEQYLDRLERGVSGEELIDLAQELTVPETYFFRHIGQFRAFSDVALPARLQARAADKVLRIVSAGCASGEEAYTIAMLLREPPLDPAWNVSIRAVDLHPSALEKAASGRFSAWSMRETPAPMQDRWFRPSGRDLLLDESVMAQVTFEQRNLAQHDADLWRPGSLDVVFCRNVLMYFVPEAVRAVVDSIARALVPGGYLFLGHAETLRGVSHDFHLCHANDAFFYQRSDADVSIAAAADASAGGWVASIDRSADRIRALSGASDGPAAPMRAASPVDIAGWDLSPPLELLRQERFADALGLIQALPPASACDPDVRLLEAVLLVHSGALDRAERACTRLLELDELNAGAHYVLALCCEGGGDPANAVEHAQIASHLDPAFAMPRLHLGMQARRAGQHADARRELGQALALLQREDASRLLFFGGGFQRDALVALCRAELIASGGRP
jgi:chemotaxis protein methyltransferase CheR